MFQNNNNFNRANSEDFIRRLNQVSWGALVTSSLCQVFFLASIENIFAIACIWIAWIIVTFYYFKNKMIMEFPLSSFLIIGYVSTQFYFPLIFTTLENKPVVYNLVLPISIFIHSTFALFILLISHAIYRLIVSSASFNISLYLDKSILFRTPYDSQMWLMGFLGMLASTYLIFFSPESNREVTGSIIDKSVHGFIPFSYAPYFIPFKKLFSKRNENTKGSGIMIVGYTILLFIISIAQNNRTSFMLGFTSIGFTYGLGLLIGSFRPYLFSFKNIMFILIGFWLITGPIADLGTAMVIVRGDRNDIKASELIMRTLEKFQDKRAIERRRNEDRIQQEEWDERYLNNIIIARFANLKFNDISLIQELKIGDKNIDMYNYSINYIWGALPDPFLKFLNINVNKEFIYSISFGDYLYYLANSDSEVSVGYRLGHFSGTGMAAFGWWYLLILGVGIIPIFLLFDLFVIKAKIKAWNGQVIVSDLKFSLCGLLSLTSIFLFLPSESVVAVIIFLIRGWLQLVILYLVVFYFTNFAYKIMNAFTLKLNHNN